MSRSSAVWPGRLSVAEVLPNLDPRNETVTTTIFISNLHGTSNATIVKTALKTLSPQPELVSISVLTNSVVVRHHISLAVHDIVKAFERSGFDVHSAFQEEPQHYGTVLRRATLAPAVEVQPHSQRNSVWQKSLEHDVKRWQKMRRGSLLPGKKKSKEETRKHEAHVANCAECQQEERERQSASKRKSSLTTAHSSDIGPTDMRTSVSKTAQQTTVKEKEGFYDGLVEDFDEKNSSSSWPRPEKESFVVVDTPVEPDMFKAILSITGMTCSSCVAAITTAVEELPWVRSINVNLLTNSAVVVYRSKDGVDGIVEEIQDAGFEVRVEENEPLKEPGARRTQPKPKIMQQRQQQRQSIHKVPPDRPQQRQSQHLSQSDRWRAVYAVGGMTCSSCVGHVTKAVKELPFVEKVDVNLLSNSATVVFVGKDHVTDIQDSIEDAGFDAAIDTILPGDATNDVIVEREISIRIDGMYCPHCPARITEGLENAFGDDYTLIIEDPPLTEKSPILNITYIPAPPFFTIRHIFNAIRDLHETYKPSIHHPPTIEDRAREMHKVERRRILYRLILCILDAIPTFLIGIVFMSLLAEDHPTRKFIMEPMWAGNCTRASWALFILATPIYFFAADIFHVKTLKEIKAIWRPGSRMPFLKRFTRFGSMNMLISLGTTIAYFASVVELGLAATKQASGAMTDTYFDTVVFLTMFLLIGRFLEALSKSRTGDAVASLGKLRPTEAMLVDTESGDRKIPTDLLEIDDNVRVLNGASPPFDGIVIEGSTKFDESSLTGESRAVNKNVGDIVYSGTVNKGAPVKVKLTTISGTSMLDQIIEAVREGQTRRAPVERVADAITGHFVPFVVLVAITTWVVWLSLGASGTLPNPWKPEGSGPWSLWSLRFAIAVFVIACPCGIGLAAPTALFVGGGLAAKHGILVKGGGEAFQEASSLDCIVFDKTGTLTQGGDPAVRDMAFAGPREQALILSIVQVMEESSNHPIARALVSYCEDWTLPKASIVDIEEIPGKGLTGTFRVGQTEYTAIVGNEKFMAEHRVPITIHEAELLLEWQARGDSVALIAIAKAEKVRSRQQSEDTLHNNNRGSIFSTGSHSDASGDVDHMSPLWESKTLTELPGLHHVISKADKVELPDPIWELAAIFGIADPLRPEAPGVIRALRKQGIDVWMLSGDNKITANAVGTQVGIPASNIIAGVLPEQKAEKITYLQRTLTKSDRSSAFRTLAAIRNFLRGKKKTQEAQKSKRATIAMVGDGINDAPALSTADLSIAIGSGSDIALSSSSFILINSHLGTLLTLLDLSKCVFRRVYFNFGWALVYNMIAMPIAAGVLYPIKTSSGNVGHGHKMTVEDEVAMATNAKATGEKHIRLDPVWASLAMALSSVSVVCSSLALRTGLPGLGFRPRKRGELERVGVEEVREETVDGVR